MDGIKHLIDFRILMEFAQATGEIQGHEFGAWMEIVPGIEYHAVCVHCGAIVTMRGQVFTAANAILDVINWMYTAGISKAASVKCLGDTAKSVIIQ
jgi:hypothetical protein